VDSRVVNSIESTFSYCIKAVETIAIAKESMVKTGWKITT
jgi:hypothetical protein